MGPHPIIMHALWDDRSREIEAEVTWSRFAHTVDEPPDADAAPARRHHLVGRALALLAVRLGFAKGDALGTSV